MANRSYLYSLSNRPSSYADRPQTISGLSEWAYDVPFSYRILMSGDPQLCASLISDGFNDDSPNLKSKLYAINSDFELGFEHLKKFFAILQPLISNTAPHLAAGLAETVAFLEAHRDRYLLLETVELDTMQYGTEAELKACVEKEIKTCLAVGDAIDALLANPVLAGKRLQDATLHKSGSPFDPFYGLRLDDDYDNLRDSKTECPLGLEWSDVLYFDLWNLAEFEANADK